VIRPLIREFQIAYYAWAQREINPLHPDVGHIATRLVCLRAERECAPPSVLRRVYDWI